jgi:hypothetical protein
VKLIGRTEADKLHDEVITARARLRDVEDRHEQGWSRDRERRLWRSDVSTPLQGCRSTFML